MKEFKSFYKENTDRKANVWCRWTTRIDTYGCGCEHDCSYCYAKALLNFRGLWNPAAPSVANADKIARKIAKLEPGSLIRLGGMTDCFQPIERQYGVTHKVIQMLNERGIHYLIVTKSDMVAEYMDIMDKRLAHIQITITTTDDALAATYEHACPPSKRIAAIERLNDNGFDVSVRLSPFVTEAVDIEAINAIRCDKILIEFLKVNSWIKKWFHIDYSPYTLKYGGYEHLPLERKIELVNRITGFREVSVGEYVKEHYEYFRAHVNHNPDDCCNIRL